MKGTLGDEDCALVLYPTLLFGLDLKAMEAMINQKKESYLSYYSRASAQSEAEDERETEEEQTAESHSETEDFE